MENFTKGGNPVDIRQCKVCNKRFAVKTTSGATKIPCKYCGNDTLLLLGYDVVEKGGDLGVNSEVNRPTGQDNSTSRTSTTDEHQPKRPRRNKQTKN